MPISHAYNVGTSAELLKYGRLINPIRHAYNPSPTSGGAPVLPTWLQSVYDPVKPGVVPWTSTGAAPDTAGVSYPGPGPFGGTSNYVVLDSW